MSVNKFATPPNIIATRVDKTYPFSSKERAAITKERLRVMGSREGDGLKLSATDMLVSGNDVLFEVSGIRYSELTGLGKATGMEGFPIRAHELGIRRLTTNNAIITADRKVVLSGRRGLVTPAVNGFIDAEDFRTEEREGENFAIRAALRELQEEYGVTPGDATVRISGIFDHPLFGISIASIIRVNVTSQMLLKLKETAIDGYENPKVDFIKNGQATIEEFIRRNESRMREILRFLLEQIAQMRTF